MKKLLDTTIDIYDVYGATPSIAMLGTDLKTVDVALFGPLNTTTRWEVIRHLIWVKHGDKIVSDANFTKRLARYHFLAFMELGQVITRSSKFASLYASEISLLSEGGTMTDTTKTRVTAGTVVEDRLANSKRADGPNTGTGDIIDQYVSSQDKTDIDATVTNDETVTDTDTTEVSILGPRLSKLQQLVAGDEDIAQAWTKYLDFFTALFLPTLEVIVDE
jgi:hypothetical protein